MNPDHHADPLQHATPRSALARGLEDVIPGFSTFPCTCPTEEARTGLDDPTSAPRCSMVGLAMAQHPHGFFPGHELQLSENRALRKRKLWRDQTHPAKAPPQGRAPRVTYAGGPVLSATCCPAPVAPGNRREQQIRPPARCRSDSLPQGRRFPRETSADQGQSMQRAWPTPP